MMSLLLERPALRAQPRRVVGWVLGAALLVATFVPLTATLEDMPRADITFVNPSPWDIHVDLLIDGAKSRVKLATIGRRDTVQIREVGEPDGDTWTFEFTARHHATEVTVSDDKLRASHHRLPIPDGLLADLEAAHAPPSP